jgi:large subunit ribosomal protein L28
MEKINSTKHVCQICGKGPVSGYNKPHSLHRTKRVVKPNTQRVQGQTVCTRCLRTSLKKISTGKQPVNFSENVPAVEANLSKND